jgi:hypothetical protein
MMPAYDYGYYLISRYWNKKWLRYQLLFFPFSAPCNGNRNFILYHTDPAPTIPGFGWALFSEKTETLRKQYPEAFIFRQMIIKRLRY